MRLRQCVYYAAYFYVFLATWESPKRTDSRGTLEGECLDLMVSNGQVLLDTDRDIIKVAAIERIHEPGKKFVGFIRGLGLKRGRFQFPHHSDHAPSGIGQWCAHVHRSFAITARGLSRLELAVVSPDL